MDLRRTNVRKEKDTGNADQEEKDIQSLETLLVPRHQYGLWNHPNVQYRTCLKFFENFLPERPDQHVTVSCDVLHNRWPSPTYIA